MVAIVVDVTLEPAGRNCEEFCGLWYVVAFFGWLLGLSVIGVITLLGSEVRYRRKMRAIAKEREGEQRRF